MMQGTLSEIDLGSILQLIELGQRTGELLIEPWGTGTGRSESAITSRERVCWFLFFVNGRLVYAADKTYGQLQRLREYLRRYQLSEQVQVLADASLASTNAPEYATLWSLLAKNILTPLQARHIIQGMVQETLFDLLNLRQGRFTFVTGTALDPPLTAFAISPLMGQMMTQMQQWKQCHPHIQCPDQVISAVDEALLLEMLPEKLARPLIFWANHHTSLRQLARYLHRNLPAVARSLYPYIEKGIVHLAAPSGQGLGTASPLPRDTKLQNYHIICIDDDATVGRQVEQFLQHGAIQVTVLTDPRQALVSLLETRPDLILCDITMPVLDGYELCAMLRQTRQFQTIPIIMLTGKDAFLDRVLARMVGATDYLTKPFGKHELHSLLETHLRILWDDLPAVSVPTEARIS
ncbi:response regulator [Synechocystis sp. LKSZ1]|uniref:response regulator n=1 Tax=Synechocystis sp. LKSZ1 TaxID=3144951 RepID=UPI00336C0859